MEIPDFRFSFPLLEELPEKITHQEILSVFWNANSKMNPLRQYPGIHYYMIGFSSKKRFIELFLNYEEEKVNFKEVIVADEDAIREGYC